MNRPLTLSLVVFGVWIALPLSGDGRTDGPKPGAGERPPEVHSPAAATSPEAVTERFLTGLLEGDEDKVVSCYDRSTDEGKAEAELYRTLARQVRASRAAEKAAAKKFGEKGLAVVRDELGIELGTLQEKHSVQQYVEKLRKNELEFFFNLRGDKAVVKVPGNKGSQWWELERKGDRWYLSSPPSRAALGLALAGAALAGMEDLYSKVPKIVAESKSAEELRKRLREAMKAASIEIRPAK